MFDRNYKENPKETAQEKAAFAQDERKLTDILNERDLPEVRPQRQTQREIRQAAERDKKFNTSLGDLVKDMVDKGLLRLR